MTLSDKSTIELMNMYAQILTELKARNIIRTYNSPIGDYAEWLVSKKLGLTLERNSKKGYARMIHLPKRGIKSRAGGNGGLHAHKAVS